MVLLCYLPRALKLHQLLKPWDYGNYLSPIMIVWGTLLWGKDSHSWSICEALTLKHKVFPFVMATTFQLLSPSANRKTMMKQMKTANTVSRNSKWNHLLIVRTPACFFGNKTRCAARVMEAPPSNIPWSHCSRRNIKFGPSSLQNLSCFGLLISLSFGPKSQVMSRVKVYGPVKESVSHWHV